MRFVKNLILTFIILFIVACCGVAIYFHTQGYQILSAQTGSMVPTFYPGDAVLTRKTTLTDLKVGDIVSYRNPRDTRVIVSHRLISINYQTGKLITEGDALSLQDVPFPSGLVAGKVFKVVPDVGYILDWLHNPIGLIVVIYTPAAFILVSEARRLAARYRKPYYQLDKYRLGYR